MKKLSILFFIVIAFSSFTFGQFQSNLNPNQGLIEGGLGLLWIDGEPHYSFRIAPEIGFSKIGVGLDLRLELDKSGSIRKENFNEASDYLSIIRYVRYGSKKDPVYARIGALDYATLGHGSIMYLYNNSPSYDARKIGLELDLNFDKFGFESVYGTFGQKGVFGLRGYVLPMQFTQLASVPVIRNLEIGATFATDFNEYAGVTSGIIDPLSGKFKAINDEGAVSVIGFDIGLPVVRTSMLTWNLYFDYVKMLNYGSGGALGTSLNFTGLGLVNLQAKLERRFNGDGYIPSYFNSMYEIERFNYNPTTAFVSSKVQTLKASASLGDGFFGELLVSVLGYVNIIGSYQRLDKHPDSGILHLSTNVTPEDAPYILRAGYDKRYIKDEKDIFTLDDRSYLYAEVGYKPVSYLIVSMVYHWTFTPLRDKDDNVIEYLPQKKFEPRVSFVYPLNF